MKKMSKKAYTSLVALLLCLFCLVGCTSTDEPSSVVKEEVVVETIGTVEETESEVIVETATEEELIVETNSDLETTTLDTVEVKEGETKATESTVQTEGNESQAKIVVSDIPEYTGQPYIVVNENVPFFNDSELSATSYEYYSPLDSLGRCGMCVASVGKDIMPTEERGSIGDVKPSGWNQSKYPGVVDGNFLYNRCHLLGYQLTGENANTQNLITGTRYLNVDGMLPFENMVADYVKETGNHVMYRTTPLFNDNDLLAKGVLLEAKSVEDKGSGVMFCVYCYNVQPGVTINYADGSNQLDGTVVVESSPSNSNSGSESTSGSSSGSSSSGSSNNNSSSNTADTPATNEIQETPVQDTTGVDYIANTNTKKFHFPSCGSVKNMKESNKMMFHGTREELIGQGYEPCKKCNP